MISNPPYGVTVRQPWLKTAGRSEFAAAEVCSQVASYGVFILPQGGLPWQISGPQGYRKTAPSAAYTRFAASGWEIVPNCGLDCSVHKFSGVSITVEIGIVAQQEDV